MSLSLSGLMAQNQASSATSSAAAAASSSSQRQSGPVSLSHHFNTSMEIDGTHQSVAKAFSFSRERVTEWLENLNADLARNMQLIKEEHQALDLINNRETMKNNSLRDTQALFDDVQRKIQENRRKFDQSQKKDLELKEKMSQLMGELISSTNSSNLSSINTALQAETAERKRHLSIKEFYEEEYPRLCEQKSQYSKSIEDLNLQQLKINAEKEEIAAKISKATVEKTEPLKNEISALEAILSEGEKCQRYILCSTKLYPPTPKERYPSAAAAASPTSAPTATPVGNLSTNESTPASETMNDDDYADLPNLIAIYESEKQLDTPASSAAYATASAAAGASPHRSVKRKEPSYTTKPIPGSEQLSSESIDQIPGIIDLEIYNFPKSSLHHKFTEDDLTAQQLKLLLSPLDKSNLEKKQEGLTPFQILLLRGDATLIQAFIEVAPHDLDLTLETEDGWNPLHLISYHCGINDAPQSDVSFLINYFITHGLTVASRNQAGHNALHLASYQGNYKALTELFKHHNADNNLINTKSSDGYAPIHYAAVSADNTTEVMSLFTANPQAEINILTDELGKTALMYLTHSDKRKVIQLSVDGITFISRAAENSGLLIVDNTGKTCLDYNMCPETRDNRIRTSNDVAGIRRTLRDHQAITSLELDIKRNREGQEKKKLKSKGNELPAAAAASS